MIGESLRHISQNKVTQVDMINESQVKKYFGSVKPIKKTFRQMSQIVKTERAKRYRDKS